MDNRGPDLTRFSWPAARRWCPAAAARRRAGRLPAAPTCAAAARPARPTGWRRSVPSRPRPCFPRRFPRHPVEGEHAVRRLPPAQRRGGERGDGPADAQRLPVQRTASSRRPPDSAATVSSRHSLGCGSHGSAAAPAGEKPNGGSVPDHGSGTRQPSRPGSAPPCGTRSGPGAARRGCPGPPTGRVPRPGRCRPSRAAPWSAAPPPGPGGCRGPGRRAGRGSTGRRSRSNDVSARPYRDTTRSTSWLDSTQVAGAPSGALSASVWSMTGRSSAASHGQFR